LRPLQPPAIGPVVERRPLAELTAGLSIAMLKTRGRTSARTLGMVLGAHYERGAFVPDGTPPPDTADPVGEYVPSARPGHRAPHVWLDATGNTSTLDLFGREFVLLVAGGGSGRTAYRALRQTMPVRVKQLPVGSAAQLYGLEPQGCVLVRPDGYVAARWTTPPIRAGEQVEDALAAVLSNPGKRANYRGTARLAAP